MTSILCFIFFSFSQEPKLQILDHYESVLLSSNTLLVSDRERAIFSDTTDILASFSNTNISGGSNRIRFIQIRGVGEVSQYENTPTHSVSYLVESVDVTGVLAHWPLLDVQRMNIDKAPASIHYGGNAIGGVIETHFNRKESDGVLAGTLDSRSGHGLSLSLPIADHRVSVHYNNDAGYIENTLYNQSGNSRREIYAAWVSDWKTDSALTLQSTLLLTDFKNQYDVWSLLNNGKTSSDRVGDDNLEMFGGAIKMKYNLNTVRLEYWSSLVLARSLYSYDADWSHNSYWNSIPGWSQNYDYYDQFERRRWQAQNKWSVHSDKIELAIHMYNILERSQTSGFKNGSLRSYNEGDFEQSSLALTTKYNWWRNTDSEFSISARWDLVETSYKDLSSLNDQFEQPQFALSAQWNKELNNSSDFFVALRSGYKNPIFNIDPDIVEQDRRVDSELAFHCEVGHQYSGGDWGFAQSVFAREGRSQQVRVSRQLDTNDPSSFVYFYDNAAETHYSGYEINIKKKFINGAQAKIVFGLLKAHFRNYVFDGTSLSGRGLAHAPKSTWLMQWSEPLSSSLSLQLVVEGKSAFYYSNNHNQKSSPYSLFHLSAQYTHNRHQLDIGVRNIFNKEFALRGFYFANEPPDFLQKLYVQNGGPQTFYVNYRKDI